jgi:hypothetical protein
VKPDQPTTIAVGRIELRQAVPHGIVHITHTGKSGAKVTLAIDARLLEAWAIRQMKQEVFAQ